MHQQPASAELDTNRKILIIDDDPDFSAAQQEILELENYTVITADNVASAKEILAQHACNVALVDVRLGANSGIDLIGEITELQPNCLCVMSTAFASVDTAVTALQNGAYDYLRKPFHPEDLLATLGRCFEKIDLEQRKLEAENDLLTRNNDLENINQRLKMIVESMEELAHCSNLSELCPAVMEQVARNMAAEGGSVYLIENNELVLKDSLDPGHAPTHIPLPLKKDSVFEKVIRTKQPMLVMGNEDIRDFLPSGWSGYDDQSLLVFPLLGEHDVPMGVLSLHEKKGPRFTDQDRKLGLILISYSSEAIRTVKALEELRKNEEKYAKAFSAVPDMLAISRLNDGVFIEVNEGTERNFGYQREELIGQSSLELGFWTDPEHRKLLTSELETNGSVHEMELILRIKSGELRDFILSAELIEVNNEECMLFLARDITERKQTEEQLRHSQKMEMVGQMAGGIAHDFNNLLTVVIGNLEFLHSENSSSLVEDDLSLIQSAINAAQSGAKLTHSLLTISRKQSLQPQDIEVHTIIDAFIHLASRTLGKQIEIIRKIQADSPMIHVDPTQLENALLNLAINSRDAMPDGGSLTVKVYSKSIEAQNYTETDSLQDRKYVVIEISDTGAGMSEELIRKAQEPFFTTKETGKGTGLGLSTVCGFVKQSGGYTSITSVPGEGTSIALYFPMKQFSEKDSSDEMLDTTLMVGSETILVVDDEPLVHMIATRLLKEAGYEVIEAENSAQAISILDSRDDINLLFSDINMPGDMDGYGLSRWVKQHRPGMKILLTSGYFELSDDNQVVNHEDIPLLKKPYKKSELLSGIRAVLDSSP